MIESVIALIIVGGLISLDWVLRILALLYIPKNRKPTAATAWLMAIFFIPYIGITLFLLIGNSKLPKKRRQKQYLMTNHIRELVSSYKKSGFFVTPDKAGRFKPVAELIENLTAQPVVIGNSAELLPNYNESINRIALDIDRAKNYVHIEYFIISDDTITAKLMTSIENAVKRGVKVRILLDHMGSYGFPNYKQTIKRLRASGAETELMLPVQPLKGKYQRPDLRNHRKIVVIDNFISYGGSQNLIDRTYLKKANLRKGLKWQELVVRMEGPVAAELNSVFITDWYSETNILLSYEDDKELALPFKEAGSVTCQILPSGPGFETENNLKLFMGLMYEAKEKIVLTSPYFVPDDAMMAAVTGAAYRGVDVTLYVSEIGDQFMVFNAQRSYYEQLLRAGVKIRAYKAPYILHAKHLSVDDDVAYIGSSNMDVRSLVLDLEVCVVLYDKKVVAELRKVESDYYKNSKEIKLSTWLKRPVRKQLAESVTRLTSALQ